MAKVLLYNIKKPEKLAKIRFILFKLGLRGQEVLPNSYGHPIGYLAGMDGFVPSEETPDVSFPDEMLVMCHLSSPQFSAFLNALRQNRVTVSLKAVLTDTNAAWTSVRLHKELAAEHEALQNLSPKEASGKSKHAK